MNPTHTMTSPTKFWTGTDWIVPTALIALAFIPSVAGIFRLATLVGGAEITAKNARFFASPAPVVLHIFSATIYCILGAFQFSPRVRRKWPGRHRAAGRILVGVGLVAALSGLWMAMFYAIVPADSALLHGFRLFFGAMMAVSILLGFIAIRRRDVSRHQAWMRRAYAIGQGAGTQALTQIPILLVVGKLDELTLALAMGGGWMVNLVIAEWLNQKKRHLV